LYPRSRYYPLYINGQYWGIHQTQERGESDFASTYMGGKSEDWDTVKTSSDRQVTASDGNISAYHAFHNLAINQGFAGQYADNYWRVRGLNPDGSPNPAFPKYLDEYNLIAYMMCAWFTGDGDAPISDWGWMANNLYALYNRAAPDGFKWLRHDAEHSLGANGGYGPGCNTTWIGSDPHYYTQGRFNPATLHHFLIHHPEYKRYFADVARSFLYDDGPLTPENARARFRSRMDEIDSAIVAESARWGNDGWLNRNQWLNACGYVLNDFIPQRREYLVGFFKANGWYPSIEPPDCSHYNKTLAPGTPVTLFGDTPFWYMLDGSDPRLADGSPNPAALASAPTGVIPPTLLVARSSAVWNYYDLGDCPAPDWNQPNYNAAAWPGSGPGILGFPGNDNANPVAATTRRYVNGVNGEQVTTTYFRHVFNVAADFSDCELKMNILRDDGVILYLNGVEIFRDNMPVGAVTYDTWSERTVGAPEQNNYYLHTLNAAHLLRPGANLLAAEVHQCNATSTDLYLDLDLTAVPAGSTAAHSAKFNITGDVAVRARAFENGEWSAMSQSSLALEVPEPDYNDLRICEIMHAPIGDNPYGYFSIVNAGPVPIDLFGVSVSNSIYHIFNEHLVLQPDGAVLLVKNISDFNSRYTYDSAVPVRAWVGASGMQNIARKGNTAPNDNSKNFIMMDPAGNIIQNIWYSYSFFKGATWNTGKHLVARDLSLPANDPAWGTEDAWRTSIDGNPICQPWPDDDDDDYMPLRVNNLMFAPCDSPVPGPGVREDYAYFTILNTGNDPIDLYGVAIHNRITHLFQEHLVLQPNGWMVMADNPATFTTYYGDLSVPVRTWSDGHIHRTCTYEFESSFGIAAPGGKSAHYLSYNGDLWFGGAAKNKGKHLVALDPSKPGSDPGWTDPVDYVNYWYVSADDKPVVPPPLVFADPVITAVRFENGTAIFVITADTDATLLEVEYSNTLATPITWLTVPPAAIQTFGNEIHINLSILDTPVSSDTRFFRIR
ncbi:MAG: CotH kinase family protein, partial [Kiritimatiellaeota bacterium]|nr:CotH kinase family protein [Kiritimatiellota bacterium]